ncbi:MAG TPA: hypothetical protein VEX88_02475, partial [Glaciibacter sp.]|nr:hypothetical protein [Glaciibacter sp.]
MSGLRVKSADYGCEVGGRSPYAGGGSGEAGVSDPSGIAVEPPPDCDAGGSTGGVAARGGSDGCGTAAAVASSTRP